MDFSIDASSPLGISSIVSPQRFKNFETFLPYTLHRDAFKFPSNLKINIDFSIKDREKFISMLTDSELNVKYEVISNLY